MLWGTPCLVMHHAVTHYFKNVFNIIQDLTDKGCQQVLHLELCVFSLWMLSLFVLWLKKQIETANIIAAI